MSIVSIYWEGGGHLAMNTFDSELSICLSFPLCRQKLCRIFLIRYHTGVCIHQSGGKTHTPIWAGILTLSLVTAVTTLEHAKQVFEIQ